MKIAYVVGWQYDTGGGFDWYFNAKDQEKMYQKELENERDPSLAKENWKAFKFEFEYDESLTNDEVTDKINEYTMTEQFDKDFPELYELYLKYHREQEELEKEDA
jgi:hypothetical protein